MISLLNCSIIKRLKGGKDGGREKRRIPSGQGSVKNDFRHCPFDYRCLFNLALFIGGLILVRHRKPWLLVISLSSSIHLVLDRVWDNPVALWWPLLGHFYKVEPTGWSSSVIHALSSDPGTYIPEIIGLMIMLFFGCRLLVHKNIINFIRTGAIG